MRTTEPRDLRCSYVVLVERNADQSDDDLRDLAAYLSALRVDACEVVILDASLRREIEHNRRILRWVGRYVYVGDDYRDRNGEVDLVRAAAAFAGCEKVLIATADVRYDSEGVEQMCRLLDVHEVVEPQEYVDPISWWGRIDGARVLIHRGVNQRAEQGATFGFRRSALGMLRTLATALPDESQTRGLRAAGAEVYATPRLLVRRESQPWRHWLTERPRAAARDFDVPMKTMFFLSLIPFLALLSLLGGARLAAGYGGVIAFASIGLAFKGRFGAASVFPLRTLLFAPLWVLERAISVYWAMFRSLRVTRQTGAGSDVAERSRRSDVASGQ